MCNRCELPFSGQFWLGERQELLRDLIYIFKYKYTRNCATVFADLFFEIYGAFLNNKIVVPLPTIGKHIRERGFDHTDKLAEMMVWRCGGLRKRLLARNNNTIQVGADAETRKKQVKNAYMITSSIDKDAEYVLVDDV